MSDGRKAGDEEREPDPGSGPNQEQLDDSSNGRESASPKGAGEIDAISATGAVTGRGPFSPIEFQPSRVGLARGLAALQHRDFRLFWLTQLISLVGTWMQVLAQGWLVLEIGGSAFDLGSITALQFLPTLLFSLFGGVLADQFPKRRLLLATQSAAMALAFTLAGLTWSGTVAIWQVMILATLLGLVSAVDMPTRQAWVVELAGARDLPNAVALNSAAFNTARLAGPALGGLLIGWVGTGTVFFLNGVSFLPVIAALFAVRAGATAVAGKIKPGAVFRNVREGLSYVRRTPMVLATVILIAVVGTFGMNFSVIAPLLAKDTLAVGADGLGFLMSSMGVGSLIASLMLAFLDWAPHPRLLVAGAGVFGLVEMVLSQITEFLPAAILFGAIGFAMIVLTTVANTGLQTSTPNHLRGRVMSVYTMVFVGTTPLGSLFAGSLAEVGGVPLPLLIGGAISMLGALFASWQMSRLS